MRKLSFTNRYLLELTVLAAFVLLGYFLLLNLDAYDAFYQFTRTYESWELDEALLSLPLILVALVAFNILRVRDARLELHERRIAESRALAAEARVMDLMKAKEQFMAVMSHELKTPLNGMIGVLSLMVTENLTPEQMELAQIGLKKGHDLNRIISDVLNFIQLDQRHNGEIVTTFSPSAVTREVHQILVPKARQKNLDMPPPELDNLPELLLGYEAATRHILMNIVGNAIKFTDRGSIRIVLSHQEKEHDEGLLVIAVTDTGSGISPQDVEKIFEPYSQLQDALVRRSEGIGLGLSLVKRLVSILHGDISVQSVPGEGSTFIVTIPVFNTHCTLPLPDGEDPH